MLTGIGGTGKSMLATRAINRLQAVGPGVIPVQVTAGRDVAGRPIGVLDGAFLAAGRKDLYTSRTDGEISSGQRLEMAARGLKELKIGRGESTAYLIDRLYRDLGGTPGLLGQVRTLLRKADPTTCSKNSKGATPACSPMGQRPGKYVRLRRTAEATEDGHPSSRTPEPLTPSA